MTQHSRPSSSRTTTPRSRHTMSPPSSSSSSYPAPAVSRRSHTKSRKGCKTCKKRHIRCDETFPQCRNCSKHQVRCDYMDNSSDSRSSPSAPPSDLYWSSDVEATIDEWQRTGYCSVGQHAANLRASGHVLSKSDLHLIYNALWSGGPNTSHVANYTVWAAQTPRLFSAGADTTFTLHAVLGFGSLALAWDRNSADAKTLAYQHGATALQGLQTAISAFSQDNADAVLATSILLSWQVVNSMRLWRCDSRLTDTIDEQDNMIPFDFHIQHPAPHSHEFLLNYTNVLQSLELALDHLHPFTSGRDEHALVRELRDYIQRLLSVRPARTPEEQFNHLYALRKWIFWVPASRLRTSSNDYLTLVVLAHLYAIALSIEPLFPNVAPVFCSAMSLAPLQNILDAFDDIRHTSSLGLDQMDSMLSLLIWPQQVCHSYRQRRYHLSSSYSTTPASRSALSFDVFGSELAHASETFGQPSPAFQTSVNSRMSSDYSSSHGSPYLELPTLSSNSPALQRNSRNSYQSPMLPSMASGFDGSEMYGLLGHDSSMDMGMGFVSSPSPLPLWT